MLNLAVAFWLQMGQPFSLMVVVECLNASCCGLRLETKFQVGERETYNAVQPSLVCVPGQPSFNCMGNNNTSSLVLEQICGPAFGNDIDLLFLERGGS